MNDEASFAKWLTEQLDRKRMKNKQLAELLGVSGPAVSRLRNGKMLPSLKLLNRMAAVFNIELADMPTPAMMAHRTGRAGSEELIVAQSRIPDHSLFHTDHIKNLFHQKGVFLQKFMPRYETNYWQLYHDAVKSALSRDLPALICGPTTLFGPVADTLPIIFRSHAFRGYSLIAREGMMISAPFSASQAKVEKTLRGLLEDLTESNLWPGDSAGNRVFWNGVEETKFFTALEGMKQEIFDGIAFTIPTPKNKIHALTSDKLLTLLNKPGTLGYDLVIGDALCLGRAITTGSGYKVLFTLGDLWRVVAAIDENKPPIWARMLKSVYPHESLTESVRAFKAKWSRIAALLEADVYWFLYLPHSWPTERRERLSRAISLILSAISREMQRHSFRITVIEQVFNLLNADSEHDAGDFDCFLEAWCDAYNGL